MSAKRFIKLLIADDHKVVRDGLRMYVSEDRSIDIVHDCANGNEVLEFVKQNPLAVDLMLLDINMPGMSGIEVTKYVKQHYPEIKILILSAYNEKAIINQVIMSEAEGFLLKYVDEISLLKAIKHIYNNGTYYDNAIADFIKETKSKAPKADNNSNLSKRETEILNLICQEYSTDQIGEKLHLSSFTVHWHRKNILAKTGATNLIALIKYAVKYNIISI